MLMRSANKDDVSCMQGIFVAAYAGMDVPAREYEVFQEELNANFDVKTIDPIIFFHY